MILKFFLLLGLSMTAYSETLTFASQGTIADPLEMNSRGWTHAISPNPQWAQALPGSSWVSYWTTGDPNGDGFMSPPNGQLTSFWHCVLLGPGDWDGSVTLMADDSASFSVNGHLLLKEAPTAGNTYRTCSDVPVNCRTPVTVVIPEGLLHVGTNVLTFMVAQRAGSSFGLDYVATISSVATCDTPTPEPATFALAGISLIGIVAWRRRK